MNKRALVVSNEQDFSMLLEYYLPKKGYQVLVASNLEEALNLIPANTPDLVVLCRSAVMSVQEACQEIGAVAPGVEIRVC